jgi:hypothetical protein
LLLFVPQNTALAGEKPAKQANLSTKNKTRPVPAIQTGLAGWMFFCRPLPERRLAVWRVSLTLIF